jgi:polyphosphate kinase
MPRNLYERVEVMFRLKDRELCQQVCGMILAPYLADTEKARLLLPDGTYSRAHKGGGTSRSRTGTRFSVQEFLMRLSEEQEGAETPGDRPPVLKLRKSPMFEMLSRNWNETQEP